MQRLKDFLKRFKIIDDTYTQIKNKITIKRMQKNGHELLNVLHNSLNDSGLEYFLDCGTLLGFIREGDFISHDPDIDISIIYKKGDEIVLNELLLNNGFENYLTFKKNGVIVEEAYVYKKIKVDVFFYFPQEDGLLKLYGSFTDKDIQYVSPYNKSIIEKTFGEWKGSKLFENELISFPIPINEIERITERYGENWRTPVVEWGSTDGESIGEQPITHDGQQIVHYK